MLCVGLNGLIISLSFDELLERQSPDCVNLPYRIVTQQGLPQAYGVS